MSTPRPARPLGDELTNLALSLLVAAAVLAALLRAAGSVAAWVTGVGQPTGGSRPGWGCWRIRATRPRRSGLRG